MFLRNGPLIWDLAGGTHLLLPGERLPLEAHGTPAFLYGNRVSIRVHVSDPRSGSAGRVATSELQRGVSSSRGQMIIFRLRVKGFLGFAQTGDRLRFRKASPHAEIFASEFFR